MDEKEKEEISAISEHKAELMLGGEIRQLHIGMKSWKVIKEKYGGIEELMKSISSDPLNFCTDKLPELLTMAIIKNENENITIEQVEDWLDVYGLNDLKNEVVPAFMASIMDSVPQVKGPSRKAKAEK